MWHQSQYLCMLQRMIVDCGVPHMIHSDNAPEFKSEKWTKLMKTYLIKNTYTEAYQPNQNPCECHDSVLKVATTHLLLVTGAPLNFWCYALEYIALLQSVIANSGHGHNEEGLSLGYDFDAIQAAGTTSTDRETVSHKTVGTGTINRNLATARFVGLVVATSAALCDKFYATNMHVM